MPVLRFRVYWEEEESIYRDILVLSGQRFLQLHEAILQAFEFDQKHNGTFFRSNDHWERGREIILKPDNQPRKVAPLLMADTLLGDVVRNPNEKFVFVYGTTRQWTFLVELIAVTKEGSEKADYPVCSRREGTPPSQYGNKKPVRDHMIETEEQYDLNNEDHEEGFGEEGGGEDISDENPESGGGEDIF
jgi:hypothetical protein